MDLPVLTRVANDGRHRIQFRAAVLAAATTERPGAERWTELTVYRTPIAHEDPPAGTYVVARVGRSLVAHKPRCPRVNTRGMGEFKENPAGPKLVPCRFCIPTLDPPQPGLVMERTKHTLHRVRTAADLGALIFPVHDVDKLRGMTADAVAQLRHSDADFDHWWDHAVAPELHWD